MVGRLTQEEVPAYANSYIICIYISYLFIYDYIKEYERFVLNCNLHFFSLYSGH